MNRNLPGPGGPARRAPCCPRRASAAERHAPVPVGSQGVACPFNWHVPSPSRVHLRPESQLWGIVGKGSYRKECEDCVVFQAALRARSERVSAGTERRAPQPPSPPRRVVRPQDGGHHEESGECSAGAAGGRRGLGGLGRGSQLGLGPGGTLDTWAISRDLRGPGLPPPGDRGPALRWVREARGPLASAGCARARVGPPQAAGGCPGPCSPRGSGGRGGRSRGLGAGEHRQRCPVHSPSPGVRESGAGGARAQSEPRERESRTGGVRCTARAPGVGE